MNREKKRSVQNEALPNLPKSERWPSQLPMPIVPSNETLRLLRQILQRLDIIEKMLENIEKLLAAK